MDIKQQQFMKINIMETKIKKAILDIMKGRIDRVNYGMCSKYFISKSSLDICEKNNIRITNKLDFKDTITMNGDVIGEIRYRYAAHKRNGMYKMLTPIITYID